MKGERPEDLKYTETHEWVRVSGKTATIGITDYAVSKLGDITHLELPKVGDSIEAGNAYGEIDSVKTTADLIAPVGGKIAEVNHKVANNLDLLAEGPYEDGWLVRIKMKDPSELDNLMTAEEYNDFIASAEAEEEEEEEEDEDQGEVDEDDFM